jgi:NAD(P)-dependent dehydrogenase (short-subunit alcohol dehydrogenase family)
MGTIGAFADKVVVVTGAARGLGREYALRFAADGAHVVVADVLETGAQSTAAEVRATGGDALGVSVDVGDGASTQGMAAAVIDRFGRIDVLVNNAGIWGDYERTPLSTVPAAYWDRVLAVNLTGPLLCSQAVLPSMRSQGWGRIVNISSIGAHMASGVYGVSKLALNQLTFALATEVGRDGITVNAVAPGTIDNEATRRQVDAAPFAALVARNAIPRAGTADDLYGAIRYLASDEAAWVTGQTLLVNGGFSARF